MTAWRLGLTGPIGVGKDTVGALVAATAAPGSSVLHLKIGSLVVADLGRALGQPAGVAVQDGWFPPALSDSDQAALAALRNRVRHPGVGAALAVSDLDLALGPGLRRETLQWWGALRRAADRAYWLDATAAALRTADHDVVYVSDVRGAAEIRLLRGLGFFVVALTASAEACRDRAARRDGVALVPAVRRFEETTSGQAATHDTQESDKYENPDAVVDNSGSADQAASEIVEMLRYRAPTTKRIPYAHR